MLLKPLTYNDPLALSPSLAFLLSFNSINILLNSTFFDASTRCNLLNKAFLRLFFFCNNVPVIPLNFFFELADIFLGLFTGYFGNITGRKGGERVKIEKLNKNSWTGRAERATLVRYLRTWRVSLAAILTQWRRHGFAEVTAPDALGRRCRRRGRARLITTQRCPRQPCQPRKDPFLRFALEVLAARHRAVVLPCSSRSSSVSASPIFSFIIYFSRSVCLLCQFKNIPIFIRDRWRFFRDEKECVNCGGSLD